MTPWRLGRSVRPVRTDVALNPPPLRHRVTSPAQHATDELVHRLSGVQHLGRDFATADRKRSIEKVKLDQQRSLVPVQVLVGDLVAFELDDGDDRHFYALSGGLDAGQKPVHADRVREPNN